MFSVAAGTQYWHRIRPVWVPSLSSAPNGHRALMWHRCFSVSPARLDPEGAAQKQPAQTGLYHFTGSRVSNTKKQTVREEQRKETREREWQKSLLSQLTGAVYWLCSN